MLLNDIFYKIILFIVVIINSTFSLAENQSAELFTNTETTSPFFYFGSQKVNFETRLFAGAQPSFENPAYWGLAKEFAPLESDYDDNRYWTEFWLIPSINLNTSFSRNFDSYAGLSLAATANLEKDVFNAGNSGEISQENTYFGIKYTEPINQQTFDISFGAQPYVIGTGLLISQGGQNGGDRGATTVAPRKAWDGSLIARTKNSDFAFDAFYLSYNEIEDGSPDTELLGVKAEIPGWAGTELGTSLIYVTESDMPYAQSPAIFVESGRDGLQISHLYGKLKPKTGESGWIIGPEFVYERNPSIELKAYAIVNDFGYLFQHTPLSPEFTYSFRYFSGDNPNTSSNEKFDPLFYDGSPPKWSSGSNASLALYNSNLMVHRFMTKLSISPIQSVRLGYYRIYAAEENSPIQFGQFARSEDVNGQTTLVSGVADQHLADDLYLEYFRVLTPNLFLTVTAAASIPGSGLEDVSSEKLNTWYGLMTTLSVSF